MEEVLDAPIQVAQGKVYKEMAIRIGTFLGGPLVGGYMIAQNFKVFNEPDKARLTWVITILGTVAITGASFLIPGLDKAGVALPVCYALAVFYLAQHFQGAAIQTHLNSGGQSFGGWRVAGVTLLGLIATVAVIIIVVLISDAGNSTAG